MRLITTLLLVCALVVVAGFVFLWSTSQPPIAAIAPPAPDSFAKDTVRRGAALAALGNCASCHTAEGGRTFAGGRPIATPFGTLYGTNITPDPDSGIGRWSEAAFLRALRDGVDRDGNHLYPAFPYDHFTRMSDDDAQALYAYLMTRDPVAARPPANHLAFPLSVRPLVAAWKLLFFTEGRYTGDGVRNAELDRGAYLVETVAHCGACHTPRNALGAEQRNRAFAGGTVQGWIAPPIDKTSPAPVSWTDEELHAYLRAGHDRLHGASGGPMAEVSRNLALADDRDVRAIAAYVGSRMGLPEKERDRRAKELISALPPAEAPRPARAETVGAGIPRSPGEAIYAGACASCHDAAGTGRDRGLNLSLSTAVRLPEPDNVLHVVRDGIHPPAGERGAIMPPFGGTLTDRQIADVTNFVRTGFGRQAPWDDVGGALARLRGGEARR